MIPKRLILSFLTVFLLALSCKRAEEVIPVAKYKAIVETTDGVITDSDICYPSVSVTIDGPDNRLWRACLSREGQPIMHFDVVTGKTVDRELATDESLLIPGLFSFDLTIHDGEMRTVLYKDSHSVRVVKREGPSPDTPAFISAKVKIAGTSIQLPITDGKTDTLRVCTNNIGEIALMFSPEAGDEEFFVNSGPNLKVNGPSSVKGAVVVYSFEALSEGAGEVLFTVKSNKRSSALRMPYIVSSIPGPGPGPGGDIAPSLSIPDGIFAEKPFNVNLTVTGLAEGEKADVVLYLDGNVCSTHKGWTGIESLSFPLGSDGAISQGRHKIKAELRSDRDEARTASVEEDISVFGMPLYWSDSKGTRCYKGLRSNSTSDRFLLNLNTGCPDRFITDILLSCPSLGKTYRPSYTDLKCIEVQRLRRGSYKMTLSVTTAAGTFTWPVTADCYDLFTVSLYVNGDALCGKLTGPSGTLPSRVWVEMGAMLGAYIPYKEAIGSSTEHYTESKARFIDIEYYKRQYEFSSGTSMGNVTLQSSYVGRLLNHVRGLASGVSVEKNSSSRWVENADGSWSKQYYTPQVYPCISLSFWGTITGASLNEYVAFDILADEVKTYLENDGFYFQSSSPIWL